jgi:hypothetical protein
MDNKTIKKWDTLLNTLTVLKTSNLLCSTEKIEQVEKELGFKFPPGYKEYCSLFGSGSLGIGDMPDQFNIYCPCYPQTEFDIRNTGYTLVGLKLDLEASGLNENDEEAKIAYHLLENGYAFGGTPSADSFFWDLTSNRDDDQGYDIYWKADEDVKGITLIGRDFFEFIDKFCLGNGLQIIYSDEFAADVTNNQERFFTAFEYFEENNNYDSFISNLSEGLWEDLEINESFSENAKVRFKCSYNASNKEQAECLQRAWITQEGIEIEIIEASTRPNIPRLVEIKVSKRQVTHEFVRELSEKMIRIGKECNCSIGSYGSEINPVL